MKLLYVHNGEKVKVIKNNRFYTDGAYDEKVWDRYIRFSDNNVIFYSTLDSKIYEDNYVEEKFNIIPDNIKVILDKSITSSVIDFINPLNRKRRNKRINKLVKESEAIIIRTPCTAASTVVRYAKKYNKPYMLEVVGCIWDALWNYNLKGKILAPFRFVTMKKIVKNSKYSIYVTNEFLQKRYPTNGKSTNCSNVVLLDINNNDLDNRIYKIENNTNKIIIGTSAAVDVKYKGQDNVIKAISKLIKKGYNIEYQLIGNGNTDRLKKIAKKYGVINNIKFLGSIPHSKVFNWLENIDIYIQPSKQEGLPRALIEAMSKACPSIGTEVAGIPELLDNKCLYKKNNIKQLATKIEDFINDKLFMIEQAKNNFYLAKQYSADIINERREKFYEKFKKENLL